MDKLKEAWAKLHIGLKVVIIAGVLMFVASLVGG